MMHPYRTPASARGRWPRPARGVLALAVGLGIAGCDTEVTNPGRFEDRFLDDLDAHAAVVNGSARSLADALGYVSYTTGAITREIFPAGSTSSFGITPRQQQGILAYDDEHINFPWTAAHRARFIAEQGFDRFRTAREADGASINDYELGGRAALWAGYANRLLAENWCEATFEGGPAVAADSVLRRAENWFSRAISIGEAFQPSNNAETARKNELVRAAYAGRASVRAGLGNWAGAVSDAAMVPTSFQFRAEYSAQETDQYNRIFWAGASTPYRAHTVWRTVYADYYTNTGDPRVAWGLHPTQREGDAAVMDLGKVPFYQQQKYRDRASPINLSTGREMRLIEAEAMLRSGNWPGAMTIINSLRSAVGAPAVSAASAEEAWTRLKRERGIELWLEGRRMSDLRRWEATSTPGQLDALELPGDASKLSTQRTLCYDISKAERETNPNLPLSPGG